MSEEENETESSVGLAFVLLQEPSLPSLEAINAALEAHGPGPVLKEVPEDGADPEEGEVAVLMAELDGANAFVTLMPGPFPWSDLEGPCETAWWWPEATETLRDHGAHLVVALTHQEGDPLDRSLRLTRFVAGVLEASQGSAVYWGNGPLVHERGTFVEDSQGISREELPIHLWVDQRLFSTKAGTINVFTAGLEALGAMEIEIRETTRPPAEALEFVFGIAHYLAQNGPVIKDGDTVGGSPEEQIKARHLPSEWDREGPVLVIELP